jgi:hypothetical protein
MTDIFYVFGAGHSGSTLLDVLLSRHPTIQGLGEVHRLSLSPATRLCGCGGTLLTCPYWRPVVEDYCRYSEVEDLAAMPPVSLPVAQGNGMEKRCLEMLNVIGSKGLVEIYANVSRWAKSYREVILNSLVLYRSVGVLHEAKVVVDSTKNPLRGKMLYMLSPGRVFCIHLVRDGRAVAASMMRRESVSMDTAARRWKSTCMKVEATLWSIPEKDRHFLRYEDFCNDPLRSINGIFAANEMVELTASELDLTGTVHHEIPGNPVLHKGISDIQLDEKWRRSLSASDLNVFERIAGSINRRYGYEAS